MKQRIREFQKLEVVATSSAPWLESGNHPPTHVGPAPRVNSAQGPVATSQVACLHTEMHQLSNAASGGKRQQGKGLYMAFSRPQKRSHSSTYPGPSQHFPSPDTGSSSSRISKQLPAALEKRRWLCRVIHTTACFLAVQRTTQTHTSPSRRVTETQFLDYYTQSHLLGFKPASDIARPREFTHWPGSSA